MHLARVAEHAATGVTDEQRDAAVLVPVITRERSTTTAAHISSSPSAPTTSANTPDR